MLQDSYFNIKLPISPNHKIDEQLYQELSVLYDAVRVLVEQISYLRYGVNRGVGQISQNDLVDLQTTTSVKCAISVGANTLLHLRPNNSGELEAIVADASLGFWANAFSTAASANGKVSAKFPTGIIAGFNSLIPGKTYYLSIGGTLTALPPVTNKLIQEIGLAISPTEIVWTFVPPIFTGA